MSARGAIQREGIPFVFGILCLLAVITVIEMLIRWGMINPFIVPKPTDIVMSFERIILEENILPRFMMTFGEALMASLMLSVVGISLGVLLHRNTTVRLATQNWVAAIASAPLVLMYPLFLVIFGRSAWTIIMIAFVSALPPVILKTLEGLAGTRAVLINVGRSFKLTPSQLYWKILFPAALPNIFVGVRLGMIFALINIVGVEFLINFGGLGQLVNELAERYDLPGTYAAICFVILVSVVFFIGTERIERWLRPGT
ncbi:MAG: ABC transporter permease subunit [Hyphomicrobiales bacterium]|nr:ABC transporter permease subunit [Alphaproteobacteria bacterium]